MIDDIEWKRSQSKMHFRDNDCFGSFLDPIVEDWEDNAHPFEFILTSKERYGSKC